MLHSIYDLTTYCRKATGDVPAKLVGASSTVVGSKMYLFGGRLVSERRMVSDLYLFDLDTFVWEKLPAHPDDDVPQPRYFHSTDAWNNHLVVFGGMSNQPDSINPDDLCVLNDVRFFNLVTRRWLPAIDFPPSDLNPRARYAHLSSVTSDRLFIIGGQDFFNTWLDDVCVFDLVSKQWIQRRDYPRHCGTYRSVAVCSTTTVRSPQDELPPSGTASTVTQSGTRFQHSNISSIPPENITASDRLVHLPYSVAPTEDHPSDIYLYSNYNFTDVKRELEVFSPLPDADFTIQDRSSSMAGTTFPPGLRFPTGALLGTHLIIAGTYLAHSYQSFSIWVLDLTTMAWSRIDCGKAIETGSWFRGVLHAESNKFLIFGNQHGNLVDDYNRRLLSWEHVAVVDLEAFGIYQPPSSKLDVRMQELGLSAFEEGILTDFEIVCDDGKRIPCSRRVLEERWSWFKEQRKAMLRKARATLENLPTSTMHVPLPDFPGSGVGEEPRVDPRLTPRAFYLSESESVTLALLQYFYSLALITPLQHSPAVLSQLLILAAVYEIKHLESLVKHAMHRSLSNATSVGVYEVATLCNSRSLQIRALKTVMSYTQRRPAKRSDRDLVSEANRNTDGEGKDGSTKYVSRPRGTSDAKWRNMSNGASSSGYSGRNNLDSPQERPGAKPSATARNSISTSPTTAPVAVLPVPPVNAPLADTASTAAAPAGISSRLRESARPKPVSVSLDMNDLATQDDSLAQLRSFQKCRTVQPTLESPAKIRRPATADSQRTSSSPSVSPRIPSTQPSASNLSYVSSSEDIRASSDREPWTNIKRGTAIPRTPPHDYKRPTASPSSGPKVSYRPFGSTTGSGSTLLFPLPQAQRPSNPPSLSAVSPSPSNESQWSGSDRFRDRESQLTAVESDTGATDEEYQVLSKEDFASPSSETRSTTSSGSESYHRRLNAPNWPKQASNVRWLEGGSSAAAVSPSTQRGQRAPSPHQSIASTLTDTKSTKSGQGANQPGSSGGSADKHYTVPPSFDMGMPLAMGGMMMMSSLSIGHSPPAPRSNTPSASAISPSSTGSAFGRFLRGGSKEKARDRKGSQPDVDQLSSPVLSSTQPKLALDSINAQIASLEEERKRLKKEAKVRAMLNQTGGSVAVIGGPGLMM